MRVCSALAAEGTRPQQPAGKLRSNTAEINLSALTAPEQENPSKRKKFPQANSCFFGMRQGAPRSGALLQSPGRGAAHGGNTQPPAPSGKTRRRFPGFPAWEPTSAPPAEEQEQGEGKELGKAFAPRGRGRMARAGAAPALQKAGFTALCRSLSHPYRTSSQSD